jgi:hypothetical protein
MDPVAVVLLLDLVNLSFSSFCTVFLKLRRFHQPIDYFGEKHKVYLVDPTFLVKRLKTLAFDGLCNFL